MTHNPRCDRGRSLMANVILFWSESLLRIKLSDMKVIKLFLKNGLTGFWEIFFYDDYNLLL